ncbi:MAG: YggS family pyridoxal phosphate-dependent enzyme [Candidatus Cellulosilyticum pullistercoris]|uniref:Pyridoxal phosphate homeostasis protein n=1 Tax=Candidatus Cellulosilyticum pullistercoris TaxID=2838521 RepID=A0A9E2KEG8_9FIRM|nr:YggS family pyridoxal phosphate-dependent enzyme [Candidatus Cellulosilyticum pullistercoris]
MIKDQLKEIKKQIKEAAKKSARTEEDITLIAVSKTYPVTAIQEAMLEGCMDFGENHVQELMSKVEAIKENVNWHLIGHLQTNKVKYVIGKTALIHSVDSLKLAEEIEKQSAKKGIVTNILVEVNVADEATKYGFKLDEVIEVMKILNTMPHIKVKGLMTVAPFVENPEKNRPIFRKLYELSVDIQKQKLDNISTNILSMGMSNDYQIAIEEGATMVRIGTAIFGNRDYSKKN